LGIERSGARWQEEWLGNNKAKGRIIGEIRSHHYNEASDIVARLLASLTVDVRRYYEKLLEMEGTRVAGSEDGGEVSALKFVGLLSQSGTAPEIFRLFYGVTNDASQDSESGILADNQLAEEVKTSLKQLYQKILSAGVPSDLDRKYNETYKRISDISTENLRKAKTALAEGSDYDYETILGVVLDTLKSCA